MIIITKTILAMIVIIINNYHNDNNNYNEYNENKLMNDGNINDNVNNNHG